MAVAGLTGGEHKWLPFFTWSVAAVGPGAARMTQGGRALGRAAGKAEIL